MTGFERPTLVTVGRIMSVYGVKGWVKVFSHTEPKERIFQYQPWYLLEAGRPKKVKLEAGRPQGKGLIAQLDGITDRDVARHTLIGKEIAVPRAALPKSDGDTFYWRDLVGLSVINQQNERLGVIAEMLETGAHDVMRIRADEKSIDQRERLLPWAPDDIVLSVSLDKRLVQVDWEADY